MATDLNISEMNARIKELREDEDVYRDKMLRSPTAVSGLSSPSSKDLSNQLELERVQKAIERLTNEKLRAEWYPKKDKRAEAPDASGTPEGVVGKTIDWLSKPLYTMVGAAEYALGQGEDTLNKSIVQNLKERNTFGDVLRTSGVDSWWASAPLGFALDVAFDPINWATMGTGALIPRLGMGVYKGAAKGAVVRGAASAAKSGALQKATSLARWTPGLKGGVTFNKLNKLAGRKVSIADRPTVFEGLAKKSLQATKEWEDFSGITADLLVKQRGLVGLRNTGYKSGIKEILDGIAPSIPGGKTFMENFTYDPINWVREQKIKEALLETFGSKVDTSEALKAFKENRSIEPYLKGTPESRKAMAEILESTPSADDFSMVPGGFGERTQQMIKGTPDKDVDLYMSGLSSGERNRMMEISRIITEDADDAYTALNEGKKIVSGDVFKRTRMLAGEKLAEIGHEGAVTLDEIEKIVKSGALGETGVKWFDKRMASINNYKKTIKLREKEITINGEKIMGKYHQAMGIFRISKVAASASAWTNAVVGNMIMLQMATGRITPTFIKNLKFSSRIYRNKAGSMAELEKRIGGAQEGAVLEFLRKNPLGHKGTFGFDVTELSGASEKMDWIRLKAKEGGYYTENMKEVFDRQTKEAVEELLVGAKDLGAPGKKELKQLGKMGGATELGVRGATGGGTSEIRRVMAAGDEVDWKDIPTGPASEIFEHDAARKMLNDIAKKATANPDNYGYQALNYVFNKLPSGYESVDQSYKLASFITSTVDGYTLNELRGIKNLINIGDGDIMKVGKEAAEKFGEMKYVLSPQRALELSNVLYLNYAAMPSAVRLLRNFPIMGTPFISFMYGMALKTGQTMVYNPAAFTKANFAIKEFSGTKTPFEKKALQGEYYSYLNKDAMFRMPGKFFDEHPIYINLTNMIPYYSLNMFTPSETRFNTSSLPTKLVSTLQKSPIMKDPIGATLFDYLIQPMILGDSIAPQGQFGQPLYPTSAGAGKKALYGARSLAEAFVPGGLAYTGFLGGLLPDKAIEASPLYQWRGLARAVQAKNPIGITSKEGAASRTFRRGASISGIPVQSPVDLTYIKKSE